MSNIWCAIPVYNNAGTIIDIARRTHEQIDNILVIDDGSTDADLRELLKVLDVTVIRHEKNRGKGVALRTAFEHASKQGGEYLITLDGDGQHFPEDIPRFLPYLAPDAILLGRRDEIIGEMPGSSEFGRNFSDFWIRLETGQRVSDSQSGFRAYPIKHVQAMEMWSKHYNFEVEVLTRALWAGLTVNSVPIRVWYPPAGTRVSSFRPFVDNVRISRLHVRLIARRLLPWPHRQLSGINGGVA